MASDGTIYAEEALRELREIVAEYGEDTKRDCKYAEYKEVPSSNGGPFPDEVPVAPHCIVGVYLHRHGVSLTQLQDMEGGSFGEPLVRDFVADAGLFFDGAAARVLSEAQYSQDDGHTWGHAVEVAARVIEKEENA